MNFTSFKDMYWSIINPLNETVSIKRELKDPEYLKKSIVDQINKLAKNTPLGVLNNMAKEIGYEERIDRSNLTDFVTNNISSLLKMDNEFITKLRIIFKYFKIDIDEISQEMKGGTLDDIMHMQLKMNQLDFNVIKQLRQYLNQIHSKESILNSIKTEYSKYRILVQTFPNIIRSSNQISNPKFSEFIFECFVIWIKTYIINMDQVSVSKNIILSLKKKYKDLLDIDIFGGGDMNKIKEFANSAHHFFEEYFKKEFEKFNNSPFAKQHNIVIKLDIGKEYDHQSDTAATYAPEKNEIIIYYGSHLKDNIRKKDYNLNSDVYINMILDDIIRGIIHEYIHKVQYKKGVENLIDMSSDKHELKMTSGYRDDEEKDNMIYQNERVEIDTRSHDFITKIKTDIKNILKEEDDIIVKDLLSKLTNYTIASFKFSKLNREEREKKLKIHFNNLISKIESENQEQLKRTKNKKYSFSLDQLEDLLRKINEEAYNNAEYVSKENMKHYENSITRYMNDLFDYTINFEKYSDPNEAKKIGARINMDILKYLMSLAYIDNFSGDINDNENEDTDNDFSKYYYNKEEIEIVINNCGIYVEKLLDDIVDGKKPNNVNLTKPQDTDLGNDDAHMVMYRLVYNNIYDDYLKYVPSDKLEEFVDIIDMELDFDKQFDFSYMEEEDEE